MPYVRHELGRRLRIRRIPELHVKLDDSAERGTRLLHLLDELEAGTDPQAIAPFEDSLPTPVRRLPHEGDADEPAAPGAAGPERKRRRVSHGDQKGDARRDPKRGGGHGRRPPAGPKPRKRRG